MRMNWYAILQIVMWVLSKVMTDENKNGKPDIMEKKDGTVQEENE